MNSRLQALHAYPFEKLAQLKYGIEPPTDKLPITLSIGEPQHPTPLLITQALTDHLAGFAKYPSTKGIPELRGAISDWVSHRFNLPVTAVDPERQVLPVSGTREALFSFAQAVVDRVQDPVVIMPNPFYQIYEGATLLAGAEPYYLNTTEATGYVPDLSTVPEVIWQRCQLFFICSPGNPTGAVMSQEQYQQLIGFAEKYDFVIASDECYTEIYADEANPPQGLLQIAYAMGNKAFKRCVMFQSLSKRSNAPGLRSGFVAGDADIIEAYFLYRTYHGCALPLPTQYASIAAWQDEWHVQENRILYREKFSAFIEVLKTVCVVIQPPASFYIWLKTPIDDVLFTRQLFHQQNVTVLPGSFLSRDAHGINPGKNHVRIALVAPVAECLEAANRIKHFLNTLD